MKALMRPALLLTFVLLIVSACGGGEDSAPPAATVASLERVSFVSSLLSPGFSMQYPSDWRYQITDTGIILSNDPGLLGAQDDGAVIPSGVFGGECVDLDRSGGHRHRRAQFRQPD